MDDKLTAIQLAELRKKLSMMSLTSVKDAYQSAYFQCKLYRDKVPSARAIQTLVRAWREMRMVEASLNRPLDVHLFGAFPADELCLS